ncbi:MAG: hypothetical protein WB677_20295, partial [Xanthobacteraceae bacterium]
MIGASARVHIIRIIGVLSRGRGGLAPDGVHKLGLRKSRRHDAPADDGVVARIVDPMIKRPRWLRLLLLACTLSASSTATVAQDRAAPAAPAKACLGFASGLSLGTSLAFTRAKLRAGGPLTIVAFGSSSTTGFGAFGKGTAFPDVMKDELSRLHPGVTIELINSGRIMEDLPDNVARIDSDVLRYKP